MLFQLSWFERNVETVKRYIEFRMESRAAGEMAEKIFSIRDDTPVPANTIKSAPENDMRDHVPVDFRLFDIRQPDRAESLQ
jgi:hypothetical protein